MGCAKSAIAKRGWPQLDHNILTGKNGSHLIRIRIRNAGHEHFARTNTAQTHCAAHAIIVKSEPEIKRVDHRELGRAWNDNRTLSWKLKGS